MSVHIGATKDQVAEAILMPGDPLRARFIAETFLKNPKCYNEVRGMYGFTGEYKGVRLSVQGSGMGMPSFSIYATELIREFGARRLIRVGTCGSFQEKVQVKEVLLASSASTDSHINRRIFKGMDYAPAADFDLLRTAWEIGDKKGISVKVGPILSSDTFYTPDPDEWKLWAAYGILAVEMETSALYTLASHYSVAALSVLTVSDSFVTHESTSSQERQESFTTMMELALETAISGATQ